MINDEELDEVQDELVEQELEDEHQKDQMRLDNRSIFTIRDEIIKKSQDEE